MVSSAIRFVPALLAVTLIAVAPTAPAFYQGLEYTEIYTDEAEGHGFHDYIAAAVAEPGDDTIIFRITVTDASVVGPFGGFNTMFFDSPKDGWVAPGCTDGAAPTYFANAAELVPEACAIEGNEVYFSLQYGSLGAGPGDTLPAMQPVNYATTATGGSTVADAGGPGVVGLVQRGDYDISYTLLGCNQADDCQDAPASEGPQTLYSDLTGQAVGLSAGFSNATSDTYVYNWTSPYDAVDAAYGASVSSGSVALSIVDGNGTELLSADITADFNATETFTDVAAGDWTITLEYTEFTGSVSIDIVEHEEEADETETGTGTSGTSTQDPTSSATTTGAQGDSDGDGGGGGSNGTPGFGLVPLVAALGAVLALRRRL